MKKFIYSMIAMLALGLGFTACSDSDDDPEYGYTTTPEIAAEGVYSGIFTRIQTNSDTAQPESGEGTLTIVACDTLANIATVKVECGALTLTNEVPVNITYANNQVNFFNQLATNTMKYVTGNVSAEGIATITFDISQRSGRKTVPYRYTFEGVLSSLVEGDTAE